MVYVNLWTCQIKSTVIGGVRQGEGQVDKNLNPSQEKGTRRSGYSVAVVNSGYIHFVEV